MSTEENKVLVRRYYEACSGIKGDSAKVRALVEEFFAPAFVAHAPVSGDMNFEETIQNRANLFIALPDLNWTIYDMIPPPSTKGEKEPLTRAVAGE